MKLHSFLSPVRNFRKINFLSRIEAIPREIPSSSLEKLLKRQTFSITIIIALSSYITVTNCLVPCCSLLSSPSSSSSPVVFCLMWSCRLWCTRFQCTILYVSSHQSYSHIHILHMYAEQVPTIIYSVYTVINYVHTQPLFTHWKYSWRASLRRKMFFFWGITVGSRSHTYNNSVYMMWHNMLYWQMSADLP